MDLVVVLTTFAVIFPAELPDKTFVATLVLSTRYPPLPVWVGVTAAFLVQCLVAVAAGHAVSLLPETPVLLVTATLFTVGAVLLYRGARDAEAQEQAEEQELSARLGTSSSAFRAALASFGLLFAAEWGDLSQILTAGLAARFGDPVSVFVGSWAALAIVGGLAVLAGRALVKRMQLSRVRRFAAALFALLALLTLLRALGVGAPV